MTARSCRHRITRPACIVTDGCIIYSDGVLCGLSYLKKRGYPCTSLCTKMPVSRRRYGLSGSVPTDLSKNWRRATTSLKPRCASGAGTGCRCERQAQSQISIHRGPKQRPPGDRRTAGRQKGDRKNPPGTLHPVGGRLEEKMRERVLNAARAISASGLCRLEDRLPLWRQA